LDWSEISIEKTYHNRTRYSSLKRVVVYKISFSRFIFVSSFLDAFASFSYFTALARKSECGTFDLDGHYIVQSSSVRHYIDVRLDRMNFVMHVYHTIDQKENRTRDSSLKHVMAVKSSFSQV